MSNELLNFTPYNTIFTSNDTAIEFLLRDGVIKETIDCTNCSNVMVISHTSKFIDGRLYRCKNKKCSKKMSLKNSTKFINLNIEFKKILRGIYCWIYNYTNYQAINMCDISESTFIKIKDCILESFEDYNESIKIGGPDIRVQFDETAICNGKIITDPSNTEDNLPGTQWIVGGVIENNCKEVILKLVQNRKISTLQELFESHVSKGSIIITDGHPSYPSAVKNFGFEHEVVNHSIGFTNLDGANNNQIENIWSHFKQEYRSRGGMNKRRICLFINSARRAEFWC